MPKKTKVMSDAEITKMLDQILVLEDYVADEPCDFMVAFEQVDELPEALPDHKHFYSLIANHSKVSTIIEDLTDWVIATMEESLDIEKQERAMVEERDKKDKLNAKEQAAKKAKLLKSFTSEQKEGLKELGITL